MPRVKLTKTVIDALPIPTKDIVHWDTGCPGFGVKVTPKGRKVFVVLYRTAGAGSRLRKYTIGTIWPGDSQSGARDRPKGICRKTRRARPRRGEEGFPPKDGCRPG